ncbi:GNAT family N-acetyltransferase [uncultured Tenacibaculum sp.]|uniref:GNAT family N-acetyltransferase n=1 Tax=uncultured Tenacibaculum sp. TaxID=174713 RepID=UPI002621E7C7|nr:GNAT family N-acetyltransferase [uncultured Tenacibaculum sp.]
MHIRKSITNDLQRLMEIFHYAQRFLASLNIDQWQDGYPNEAQILNDIQNNESYVVENNEDEIIATYMLTTSNEPTYNEIDGNWITSTDAIYGVVHRIAVGENCTQKGMGTTLISYCEEQLKQQNIASMRIDTHPDNLGMQHILKKLKYTYCGIIKVRNGATRLAFEKLL